MYFIRKFIIGLIFVYLNVNCFFSIHVEYKHKYIEDWSVADEEEGTCNADELELRTQLQQVARNSDQDGQQHLRVVCYIQEMSSKWTQYECSMIYRKKLRIRSRNSWLYKQEKKSGKWDKDKNPSVHLLNDFIGMALLNKNFLQNSPTWPTAKYKFGENELIDDDSCTCVVLLESQP
ncbi:unnamed protein product [Didymodactylos carnosus]|uniref:Uncharacterized protein n=1 Tax=Didymodactylos carnosus TaxID=1234261 RepID=A0A814K125_9BILA|nr:unnamed protein product [Didymodactylos carnosus]CAF1044726.1 unnamed protein product [Didymodactylos carnosus]CAF3759659.1 unnamed protein product [Didymodactylos carnosus]CAF3814704.1 unnamed protein product [Didymodactylos carnosus]